MVISVSHLTHQIVAAGGGHGQILVAAGGPALPQPGGQLLPPRLTQTLQLRQGVTMNLSNSIARVI